MYLYFTHVSAKLTCNAGVSGNHSNTEMYMRTRRATVPPWVITLTSTIGTSTFQGVDYEVINYSLTAGGSLV